MHISSRVKRFRTRLLLYHNSRIMFLTTFSLCFFCLFVLNMSKKEREDAQTEGYERARRMLKVCTNMSLQSRRIEEVTLRKSSDNSVILCPIFKIGSTFWRRVFYMENAPHLKNTINPYAFPFDANSYAKVYYIHHPTISQAMTKIMFTRDPYARLLSFYVDKLLSPNPVYWKIVGRVAISSIREKSSAHSLQCGCDLTFAEFIKHVIKTFENKQAVDPHFQSMHVLCNPCEMKYTMIGKMESFSTDALEVVSKLNLSSTLEFLKMNGNSLAELDALLETVNQPYLFQHKYLKCISVDEALKRSWRTLQIRGIIGKQQRFPVVMGMGANTTQEEFKSLALAAREKSTLEERNQAKKEAFQELYRTVPLSNLEKIRRIYKEDFQLFDYDDMPSAIFDRNENVTFSNYLLNS
ncbi:hypothetical protein CHS0354_028418 [Potamilus streckersoni]|uniref:Carbohydrate sulfotransferase n=1 Tax=Potamilus streckersoni TaxID=2493646 RepID=A0AAE0SGJ2_9BIVA|nr:hypothetical protein CHS0354_028418 [Potamilus streckersoni]